MLLGAAIILFVHNKNSYGCDGILKVAGNSEAKVAYFTDAFSGWIRRIYELHWRGCGVYPCCNNDLSSNDISPKRLMIPLSVAGLISGDDDVNRDSP